MPPDSTVLRFDATQYKVFQTLLSPMLEQYVDWEAGECHFDNDDFRGMVEFLKFFPAEFNANLKPRELKKKLVWNQIDGLQMLEAMKIGSVLDIPYYNSHFKNGAAFIGYPTADGSPGSYFYPHGNKLGMSSVCRNKEAAWEFMRQTILPQYSAGALFRAIELEQIRIRINRNEYQKAIEAELSRTKKYIAQYLDISSYTGGPEWRVYWPDQEDSELYEKMIASTTRFYWPNKALSEVVWDTIGPYLAGDRSMEDTIDLVQNRVGLYVNENR